MHPLVVNEDTAYTVNSRQEGTMTPEGRLRVDVGTSGSYDSATAITPGTAFTPGLALAFNATTAGTITLTLSSGNTITLNVPLGFTTLPFNATNLTLGTAAGTGYILS